MTNQPAPSDTPFDFVEALGRRQKQVRELIYWRRFIDGTPLDNDIAVLLTEAERDGYTRLSAEREKEREDFERQLNQQAEYVNGSIQGIEPPLHCAPAIQVWEHLKGWESTLAERDRQLAEVWKLLGIRNGAYDPGLADGGKPGFTANGTDFYGTALQCAEATIARQSTQTEEKK